MLHNTFQRSSPHGNMFCPRQNSTQLNCAMAELYAPAGSARLRWFWFVSRVLRLEANTGVIDDHRWAPKFCMFHTTVCYLQFSEQKKFGNDFGGLILIWAKQLRILRRSTPHFVGGCKYALWPTRLLICGVPRSFVAVLAHMGFTRSNGHNNTCRLV